MKIESYMEYTICKLRESTLTHFWQKFRESKITKRVDLTKYLMVRVNFSFFHTAVWMYSESVPFFRDFNCRITIYYYHFFVESISEKKLFACNWEQLSTTIFT